MALRACFKNFAIRSDLFNRQVGALISGWQDLIPTWQPPDGGGGIQRAAGAARGGSGSAPANQQKIHRSGCSTCPFLRVDDPQHIADLGAHHHGGKLAERRDELRPVRWVGLTHVVGELVQHDEFP